MEKVNSLPERNETNMCSPTNSKLLHVQYFLFVIAVLLSITASAISIGLYCSISLSNTQPTYAPQKGELSKECRDCVGEVVSAHDNYQNLSAKDNDSDLPCCDVNIDQLIRVVQMLPHMKNEAIVKQSSLTSLSPASAYKYLLPSDQVMNFSNVDHVTVQLDRSSDETNSNSHARGVQIKEDGIEIVHTGLYYVYSSIYYQPNTKVSSEHFPYQTWFHYVYRTRPNSPAMSSVILRTVFTCCPNCSNSKDSVYTAGIFRLVAGDVIQVCLSGQGIMGNDTVKESSHLGLFMLSSGPG